MRSNPLGAFLSVCAVVVFLVQNGNKVDSPQENIPHILTNEPEATSFKAAAMSLRVHNMQKVAPPFVFGMIFTPQDEVCVVFSVIQPLCQPPSLDPMILPGNILLLNNTEKPFWYIFYNQMVSCARNNARTHWAGKNKIKYMHVFVCTHTHTHMHTQRQTHNKSQLKCFRMLRRAAF